MKNLIVIAITAWLGLAAGQAIAQQPTQCLTYTARQYGPNQTAATPYSVSVFQSPGQQIWLAVDYPAGTGVPGLNLNLPLVLNLVAGQTEGLLYSPTDPMKVALRFGPGANQGQNVVAGMMAGIFGQTPTEASENGVVIRTYTQNVMGQNVRLRFAVDDAFNLSQFKIPPTSEFGFWQAAPYGGYPVEIAIRNNQSQPVFELKLAGPPSHRCQTPTLPADFRILSQAEFEQLVQTANPPPSR